MKLPKVATVLLVASTTVGAVAVGGVAWDSDSAPNLQDEYTATKAAHNVS